MDIGIGDRTNWKRRRLEINILMLSVVYNGTAVPLRGSKKGGSEERIALIEQYID